MTRDWRLVAELAPMLRDRRKLDIDANSWLVFGSTPPMRVCDAAMEAIYTILDGKADYSGLRSWHDTEAVRRNRDELIEKLKARLSRMPEVARMRSALRDHQD